MDDDLSVTPTHHGSPPHGVTTVPHVDSPPRDGDTSSRDAITRKIRHPLLEAKATGPEAPQPASAAVSEPLPCEAGALVPPLDVSENIHPFALLPLPGQDNNPSAGPTRAGYKGLAIVVAVVVAGSAVDILLWSTSSGGHAEAGPSTEAIASSSRFANGEDLPGRSPTRSTAPRVEPLPAQGRVDDSAKTPDQVVTPDCSLARANTTKLDVAKDQQCHVTEVAAPRRIPKRLPQAAAKLRQDVRVKPTSKDDDDFSMDLRTSTARRPTTTIDETDPYAP